MNSIYSSFTRRHFSMQRPKDFTTLLNKRISTSRHVYIFLWEEKKWSALSVWIKAHCETSTFKRWHLILSWYICLTVFPTSLAITIFLSKKRSYVNSVLILAFLLMDAKSYKINGGHTRCLHSFEIFKINILTKTVNLCKHPFI